jgi:hypothetical protein
VLEPDAARPLSAVATQELAGAEPMSSTERMPWSSSQPATSVTMASGVHQ